MKEWEMDELECESDQRRAGRVSMVTYSERVIEYYVDPLNLIYTCKGRDLR